MYRNSTGKRPRGVSIAQATQGIHLVEGAFSENILGLFVFAPRGDAKKHENTPLTLSNSIEAGVGHVAVQQPRQGAQHR